MDLTIITSALSSIKTATDLTKAMKGGIDALDKAEIKYKLAELTEALADAKIQMADAKVLLIEKDNEIQLLRESMKDKASVYFKEPFYYKETEKGEDGPYCSSCKDNEDKLIRVVDFKNGYRECPTCKNTYDDGTGGGSTITVAEKNSFEGW